ncbi:hypothetical protein [Alkalibacillus almallahensis]|uniref:hypothetical protein n=1 Tax=Alkalibacillus almallahensis TaxID=1379154 RepID=UPI001422B14A|nr:hypothetical protein [Alkalibacillus almallahensis]NIK12620.1 hypothetical protein [Alkalibacillus almallahensis]
MTDNHLDLIMGYFGLLLLGSAIITNEQILGSDVFVLILFGTVFITHYFKHADSKHDDVSKKFIIITRLTVLGILLAIMLIKYI